MLFYGFNPFILVAFTAFAEDKTLLFLGIACWVLALERDSEIGSWLAAAALTAFKFLGAFAAPALALRSWRRDGTRAVIPVAAYGAVFLLSNAPWFPDSLHAFSRRNVRLGIDPPIHASPWLLVSRAGLYAPAEAKLALVVSIVAVLALYAARRIEIREAVIFSLFAGYVFLPDDAFNRLILITLPFLLLLKPVAVALGRRLDRDVLLGARGGRRRPRCAARAAVHRRRPAGRVLHPRGDRPPRAVDQPVPGSGAGAVLLRSVEGAGTDWHRSRSAAGADGTSRGALAQLTAAKSSATFAQLTTFHHASR